MRIPPYYRNPLWQRFFAGMVMGAIVAWIMFLYMHGVLQERQVQLIQTQQDTISDLTEEIDIWQNEYELLNRKNDQKLLVQDISIRIVDYKKYRIDPLSIFEMEESIREDLNSLLGKDLESIGKGKELVKRTITNKTVKINSKRYHFEIKEMIIYTTISIEVVISIGK